MAVVSPQNPSLIPTGPSKETVFAHCVVQSPHRELNIQLNVQCRLYKGTARQGYGAGGGHRDLVEAPRDQQWRQAIVSRTEGAKGQTLLEPRAQSLNPTEAAH